MQQLAKDFLKLTADSMLSQTYDLRDRWANARRVMQDDTPHTTHDSPYLKEIMNSRARKNWIRKASQTRFTEMGITIGLYEIDYSGKDVIHYFPTGKLAERFSKTRFSQAIQKSPYLREVVTNDSIELKQIGSASLHILGANSKANLKATASGRLIFDELDDWTEAQIYMAEQRAAGQMDGDKIIWGFSIPQYPNLGIDKQYKTGTQEHFRFDCPHCAKRIELEWPHCFELHGKSEGDSAVFESYLKCPECKKKLPHETKSEWLKLKEEGGTAAWEATNLDADPRLCRSFWISQLYSPTVEPWEIAVAWLRGLSDQDARRTFFNEVLGLPHIEDCFSITDAHIDHAIHELTLPKLGGKYNTVNVQPKNKSDGFYTLGVDQGGPVHHWVACRWAFHRDRVGDPNDRASGQVVGKGVILQDDWDQVHGLMRAYQIRMAVIDGMPEPTNARIFARRFTKNRIGKVYLCYWPNNNTGRGTREIVPSEDDYGANTVTVDKIGWVSKMIGRLMSGDMKLPLDTDTDFRNQLKAATRAIRKIDGDYVSQYVKMGDDHYAMAMTYAEIALKILDPSLHPSSIITNARGN